MARRVTDVGCAMSAFEANADLRQNQPMCRYGPGADIAIELADLCDADIQF
jgi:hypothetical protein